MEPPLPPPPSLTPTKITPTCPHILRPRQLFAPCLIPASPGTCSTHEFCLEKSYELEALPRLLGKLQLLGTTVSIEPLGQHTLVLGRGG